MQSILYVQLFSYAELVSCCFNTIELPLHEPCVLSCKLLLYHDIVAFTNDPPVVDSLLDDVTALIRVANTGWNNNCTIL